jgi:hypothetical protein
MTVPLLAGGGWHEAAMLATGLILLAERLSLPRAARWRLPAALSRLRRLGGLILPPAPAPRLG